MIRYIPLTILLACVGISAQDPAVTFHQMQRADLAAAAGDVDADGHADIVIGLPTHNAAGWVTVFSGETGAALYGYSGRDQNCECGATIGAAGDVDGDGFDDVLFGCPSHSSTPTDPDQTGLVRVLSGRTGSQLYSFGPGQFSAGARAGQAASGAGDVDADGFDDVIVGAPGQLNGGVATGRAVVFSGRTGARLWSVDGAVPGAGTGSFVAGARDADGDGFDDVAVWLPREPDPVSGVEQSVLSLFSVKKGVELHRCVLPASFESLNLAGDYNGDGVVDVLVGRPSVGSRGESRVLSGKDGSLLQLISSPSPGMFYGWSGGSAGDVDADGHEDLVVGFMFISGGYNSFTKPYPWIPLRITAGADLYSGETGLLLNRHFAYSTLDFQNQWSGFIPEAKPIAMGIGDVNSDGRDDLIVGGRHWNLEAWGLQPGSGTWPAADPPRMREIGAACPGSNGHLPSIDHDGRLAVGEHIDFRLRGALPSTVCALVLADPVDRDLGLFFPGLAGCQQYAESDFIWTWTTTDADGMATRGFDLPGWSSLIGLPINAQWGCLDAPANPFGATTSDALEMVFGN